MITPRECADYFHNHTSWRTSGDDTQWFIERKEDGEVVLVFKESDSHKDWKNNFRFWARPYKNMKTTFFVHSGFLKCWKLINDEVIAAVRELNPTSITVTGWSYGGAMATLAYEDIYFNFPELRDKRQMITFGAPRVVSIWNFRKIKERWNNSYRFINGADIVTCVPLRIMAFRHVCKPIHIGDLRLPHRFFNAAKYHDISGYKSSLDKIIGNK